MPNWLLINIYKAISKFNTKHLKNIPNLLKNKLKKLKKPLIQTSRLKILNAT